MLRRRSGRSAEPRGLGRVLSVLAASAVILAVATLGMRAEGQTATPPPLVFSMRLEGYAIEANTFSTATAVVPRSAYSFAKLLSIRDLDGQRGLDMEARGANGQYAGLEGAVIFSGGDNPINGNNLPGYTQAFFPSFEGFEQFSEKCAFNQTEAKETPECRDQDGPYALARVVPDQDFPVTEGVGRNAGDEDSGDAHSRSFVEPQADGSVRGLQTNRGSAQQVPGTPVMVDSYRAEQTVTTTIGTSATDISCSGEVSVAGQAVADNKELQQALAPLTVASDLRVTFEPATEPEVRRLPGGGLEASCRGPRITVFASPQGGSGTAYTYGFTFAAVGITENPEGFGDSGGSDFPPITSVGGDTAAPPPTATGSVSSSPTPSVPSTTAPAEEPAPTSTVPRETELAGNNLVRESIDALPVGVWTGLAAGLLPLAIWLLLGVTGSLARGLPRLRLPPFHDAPLPPD